MDEMLPEEDRIMRYLDGEMNDEEKSDFETSFHSDPALRQQLEELRLAKEAVRYQGIREQVTAVGKAWQASQEVSPKVHGKVSFMRTYLRYAAVAASLVIALVLLKVLMFSGQGTEKIYQEAYVSYEFATTRSADAAPSKLEAAYARKDYPATIAAAKDTVLTMEEKLLVGIAYLENDNPSAAIPVLKEVQKDRSEDFHYDADYYLALCFLKQRNYQEALTRFRQIAASPVHPYADHVKPELLVEIDELAGK